MFRGRKPEDYAWMYIQIGAGILIAMGVAWGCVPEYYVPWWTEFTTTVVGCFVVAFGIYLAIGFIAICIYLAWYFYLGRLIGPSKTARARVYFKTQHHQGIEVPDRLQYSKTWEWMQRVIARFFPGPAGSTLESWDYVVEFQIGGGLVEFAVPEDVYGSLSVGDEGVLTYKGTKLVSFRTSGVMLQ